MKIGFIGLGNVGGKLSRSLLRNKFDLTVRDLDNKIESDVSQFNNDLLNDNYLRKQNYQ